MKKFLHCIECSGILFAGVVVLSSVRAEVTRAKIRYEPHPFGVSELARTLDTAATGKWWQKEATTDELRFMQARSRDETIAYAMYSHHQATLKMTVQTFPLLPEEPHQVVLEIRSGKEEEWTPFAEAPVLYPGWSAHFRLPDWDATRDWEYRARLGNLASFEGLIREDPVEKDEIVIASMSCNSPHDESVYERAEYVRNLEHHNPDLLFFAGDQMYHHTEHTYGLLQWGLQFADVLRDRPAVVIVDDHDVGMYNLWGEGGVVAESIHGDTGGYFLPPAYVRMAERCQTFHLPDPYDPTPIQQSLGVYYTSLNVGGIDMAIIEDRKFKTGPKGRIPEMGPRPDHINDPSYDRESIDLPGLELLGERQLRFLEDWGQDWEGARMKAVLSQTAFAGAVHLHGSYENRLLADLDSNGWPQSGRNEALRVIRRALATHLCGDQHLAVVIKHGIDSHRDGPFAFTNPALVNTIYGRWWHPLEGPGGGDAVSEDLPWTGDYKDGLGNKITMYAYANPKYETMQELRTHRDARGDGYGIVRFRKSSEEIVFEAWPRFSDAAKGDSEQFIGWPIVISMDDNDGREPVGYLPRLKFARPDPVVQVVNESTGEILYTRRIRGKEFAAPVYDDVTYTVRVGVDRPSEWTAFGLKIAPPSAAGISVR